MCGRFAYHSPISVLKKRFNIEAVHTKETGPDFNTAPSKPVYGVVTTDRRKLVTMKWGVIPPWAKSGKRAGAKQSTLLINARSETVHEKPTFKKAFLHRRCLILADGYYEWKKTPSGKFPWYIRLKNNTPMAFAGVYEISNIADEAGGASHFFGYCTILTAQASKALSHIHHRMPVILPAVSDDAVIKNWLTPDNHDPEELIAIISSGVTGDFETTAVSKRVNSVKNNDASLIQPVAEELSLF